MTQRTATVSMTSVEDLARVLDRLKIDPEGNAASIRSRMYRSLDGGNVTMVSPNCEEESSSNI